MGNDVFANGREISCKAADGKSICAFPDVCMTPPENPATPPGVPVPYPNTGMAKDTTSGSKKVKISNKEVMLKNKSYFKKSTGDEAGSAAKKGVVTSTNRGKVYFTSWSMDVKFEGENVVRHLDLTTHNHMSTQPSQTPPMAYQDSMAISQTTEEECRKKKKEAENACKDSKVVKKNGSKCRINCSEECKKAQKCILVPKNKDKEFCCEPGNTGHHLVEASAFYDRGRGGAIYRIVNRKRQRVGDSIPLEGCDGYNADEAPCVCVEGTSHYTDNHGVMHTFQSYMAIQCPIGDLKLSNGQTLSGVHKTTYGEAKRNGARALIATYPESNCKEECILAQYEEFDKKHNLNDNLSIKAVATTTDPYKQAKKLGVMERLSEFIKTNANRAKPPSL
jgi:hypothetical protein